VAVALLDAGLVVTATLPCPAEMGGSIHIHKSDSSIVDTVFVCRSTGAGPALTETATPLASLVAADLAKLRQGGVETSHANARCIALGYLVRLAVYSLQAWWDSSLGWTQKLSQVAEACVRRPAWTHCGASTKEAPLGLRLNPKYDPPGMTMASPRKGNGKGS
jgi:hypothetical protein